MLSPEQTQKVKERMYMILIDIQSLDTSTLFVTRKQKSNYHPSFYSDGNLHKKQRRRHWFSILLLSDTS